MTNRDDAETAQSIVDRARRRARVDALHDIDRLRGTVVDNGRAQAERLVRSSLRRPGSQTVRRNLAGGLLRDWYTTVHTAELDATLTGAGTVPGAAEVEQTTVELHQRTPHRDAKEAFRAVALIYRLAREDAAVAATTVYDEMNAEAANRAASYTDQSVDADPIRTPILRHWYQRCYLDTIRSAFGLQRPLETVTQAEATIVAACVERGEFRRIIGADGVPILTTAKPLAETGQPGRGTQNQILRKRVTSLWSQLDWPGRLDWVRAAGLDDTPLGARWSKIPGTQQSALIAHWLDTHRQDPATHQPLDDVVVDGELITDEPSPKIISGAPESAAAEMFHQQPHTADVATSVSEPESAEQLRVRVDTTLTQIRARQAATADIQSRSPASRSGRHQNERADHTVVGHDHDVSRSIGR